MRAAARLLIATLSALPLLLWSGAAAANRCERLQAELANLPRIVADTQSTRKYASAIARQNIQLRKAKDDMRRYGCSNGSIIVFGGRNEKACNTLAGVTDRMQRNLQILDSKRRELASGVSTNGRRARLLAALDAGGCNARVAAAMPTTTTETMRTLADDEDTGRAFGILPEGNRRLSLRSLGAPGGRGNLRTVCVRTCDGGFFPISSGATTLDFRRDQQVCAMMCPQTETELFYHALSSSQETEQMTSTTTGRPYADLTNAFAYRTRDLSKPDTCGCNLTAYYQEMIRREKALTAAPEDGSEGPSGSVMELRTRPQPDRAAKAETPVRSAERDYDPTAKKVRVIGPVYLPADTSAIDLGRTAAAGVN